MKNIYNKVMNNIEIEEQIELNSLSDDIDIYEECDLCDILSEVE